MTSIVSMVASAVGQEPGQLRVDVVVAVGAGAGRHPGRHVHPQVVAGAGDRDVEQPVFLVEAVVVVQRHVGRERAVDGVEEVNGVPLQAFGRVDGGQDEVVVVELGRLGVVGGCGRGVQGDLGDEGGQVGAGLGGGGEPAQVLDADDPVDVLRPDQGLETVEAVLDALACCRCADRGGITAQRAAQRRAAALGRGVEDVGFVDAAGRR